VSIWSEVFLGVIAIATLAMAIAQVGVFIAAGLLARRVARLMDQVERELKPTFGHVNAIGRDASRAVSLATAQVERADRLLSDLSKRIDETVATVQQSIIAPAREGRALFNALRAVLEGLREARRTARTRHRAEDEDALFI
jgi:ornithine cyclodeaminase/alanine dehydrogenase-like protein (mu-crystallin family)